LFIISVDYFNRFLAPEHKNVLIIDLHCVIYFITLSVYIRLYAVYDKKLQASAHPKYEGWNFNSGNYLFTTDTK